MGKQLVGKAPLSLVRTVGGGMAYVYARQPVPAGAEKADVQRLLDEDFLDEVEVLDAVPAAVVDVVDDPGLVNASAGGEVVVEDPDSEVARPPRAAAKDAWVDFAVAQRGDGVDEAAARSEAEALTKQELVERFGA